MQKHCIRAKVKKKEQRKGANKLTKSVKKSAAAQDEHAEISTRKALKIHTKFYRLDTAKMLRKHQL